MSFDLGKPLTSRKPSNVNEWVLVIDPNFARFEKALDKFSRKARSELWDYTVMLPLRPAAAWTGEHVNLFSDAVSQAPAALAAEPYLTIQSLIRLKDLAAEQDRLGDAFWGPLREACRLLAPEIE